MLSKKAEKFYWGLWKMLHTARPEVERKAVHAALGLPESHTGWTNAHFDVWKGHCLAQARPANYKVQVEQLRMPAIRKRVFVGYLLAAMELPESYAEAVLQRMNRHGAQGGPMLTLETAEEAAMEDVMIALKKECRRRWRKKEDLLGEIAALLMTLRVPREQLHAAVLAALCWSWLPSLAEMYYEPLLVVLAVLRGFSAQPEDGARTEAVAPADRPGAEAEEMALAGEVEAPF